MALRLSVDEAIERGLIKPSSFKSKKSDKRQSIASMLSKIRESMCDISILEDGSKALVCIKGITIPSLNEVLRYDMRRQFFSINKAWRELVLSTALTCRPRTMIIPDGHVVNIHIHALRKRLLDPDNCCVKSIVDACAKQSLIPDDNPKFVGHVTTSQQLSTVEMIYVEMTSVPFHSVDWSPDQDLVNSLGKYGTLKKGR